MLGPGANIPGGDAPGLDIDIFAKSLNNDLSRGNNVSRMEELFHDDYQNNQNLSQNPQTVWPFELAEKIQEG